MKITLDSKTPYVPLYMVTIEYEALDRLYTARLNTTTHGGFAGTAFTIERALENLGGALRERGIYFSFGPDTYYLPE